LTTRCGTPLDTEQNCCSHSGAHQAWAAKEIAAQYARVRRDNLLAPRLVALLRAARAFPVSIPRPGHFSRRTTQTATSTDVGVGGQPELGLRSDEG
jgi:hypothetical protein